MAALLLRLFFIWKMAVVTDDAVYYGDIARCLLHHHAYGVEKGSGWEPTLSRLPGYPFFLAFSFLLAGEGSYRAAMLLQAGFDLLSCLLMADVARRVAGERAARWAFLLAAFCPFLMNYVATPLTECLEIFCLTAALDCALLALDAAPDQHHVDRNHVDRNQDEQIPDSHLSRKNGGEGGAPNRRSLRWWALCGVSCAGAILLRPDGGLILAGIGLPGVALALRSSPARRRKLAASMLLLPAVALAPLVPWTARNWRVFHVFQPLVTTHANDPGEFVPLGWERWFRTWMFEYASVEDVDFQVQGAPLDPADVPRRAYDSAHPEAQREQVLRLIEQYNGGGYRMTPELDRQFAALAAENIRRHPLRYYLLLPAARTLDMWLRPRVELMPLDTHFWRFADDPHDALCGLALGALNLAYVVAAVAGAWLLRQRVRGVELGLLLTYPILRSLFLATTGMAEDRYTMECLPFVFVLAAAFLSWREGRRSGMGDSEAEPQSENRCRRSALPG